MVRPALLILPALGSAQESPSPGEVVETITYQFSPIGNYCLVPGYGPKALSNEFVKKFPGDGTVTLAQCADLCSSKADGSCKSWSFVGEGAGQSDHGCYDITGTAPQGLPGSAPLIYAKDGSNPMTGLAGPCPCPNTPTGGPLTGESFPASDASDYATIFDQAKHQPAPLSCWPKSPVGVLKKAEPIVQRTNLVDAADPTYFAGWCNGMTPKALDTPGNNCKAACLADPQCNGYQWVPEGEARTSGCFFGAGYDCDSTAESTTTVELNAGKTGAGMQAERFERGFINVIAQLKKYQVLRLTFRFDPTMYTCPATPAPVPAPPPPTQAPPTQAPPTQAPATEAPATEAPATQAPSRRLLTCQPGEVDWAELSLRCKEVCYSDIWCTVWQVYNGNGKTDPGCFTEAQGNLAYPLNRATDVEEDETGIVDGEFIQHWYSQDITTTTTTTTSPPPPNRLLPILLGLGALAALLGLGAYAMGWCSPKEKVKKPRAKRALQQPDPPKEEPAAPVPTQPSFLMSAPVLTYTAAPVTYAAPVATMQAAPVTYAAPHITTASYQVVQPSSVMVPQEPMIGGFMG
jgi:hypothetical protein